MLNARTLAIAWLSSSFLLAAGLALGMQAVSPAPDAFTPVSEYSSAPEKVTPATMSENGLPEWLTQEISDDPRQC